MTDEEARKAALAEQQQLTSNIKPADVQPGLNPNDPASWAAFMQLARAQTQGINRLPGMAPTTNYLSDNPLINDLVFHPGKIDDSIYRKYLAQEAPKAEGQTDPNSPVDYVAELNKLFAQTQGQGTQNLGMGMLGQNKGQIFL